MKDHTKDFLQRVDSFLSEKFKGLDEFKNVVSQGLPSNLVNDITRLRKERDRMLQKLGEQTFLLLQQGKLIVPSIVQTTFKTAQEIVERIVRIELEPEIIAPNPAQPAGEQKPPEAAGRDASAAGRTSKKPQPGQARKPAGKPHAKNTQARKPAAKPRKGA
jgi:hypothetical protein